MTLDFLRDEIHQQIGEPSDIDPDTDVSYDGSPLLDFVVNEGLRQISTWKDPSSDRAIRLPDFIGDMLFQSYYVTGDIDANTLTDTTVILPAGSSTDNDAYNGWVVTVGGQTQYIVDYVGATLTATLADDWTTKPLIDDEYELSKNFSRILASTDDLIDYHIATPTSGDYRQGNFLIPLKISDIANNRDLQKAKDTEAFTGIITQTGTPSQWSWFGNKINFNFAPDEALWYRMEYYRLPRTLSADDDEPDIPEFLQYGIVLWGRQWGYNRQQASPEAYSAKRDSEDFMRQRLNLYSMEYLREDDYGTIRMK